MLHQTSARILALALLTGCATDPTAGIAELPGRRVLASAVVLEHDGPCRVEAHEIEFASAPAPMSDLRRARLVVDLLHDGGTVHGLVEWGPEHGPRVPYVASGLATRRSGSTTLDIVLDPVPDDHVRRRRASFPVTVGLQVVIDDATGDVTARRRL